MRLKMKQKKKKKKNSTLKEFKEFALKGNVMDMAIGVVIGGAFQKIVNSLVNDIIMPAISMLIGKVDFSVHFDDGYYYNYKYAF